jgi:hypothetical protein
MNRDDVEAKLLEIEGLLQDERRTTIGTPCTERSRRYAMYWTAIPGALLRRRFIGSMAARSKPVPR